MPFPYLAGRTSLLRLAIAPCCLMPAPARADAGRVVLQKGPPGPDVDWGAVCVAGLAAFAVVVEAGPHIVVL